MEQPLDINKKQELLNFPIKNIISYNQIVGIGYLVCGIDSRELRKIPTKQDTKKLKAIKI
ncbi:hypothetical protein BpHYR1_021858 [Brachionus plicatilis]|uniref:Uncharacterized protein n=1 Tax=Brachionus plicatilis TaxID=10195 RepID=A0A3M7T496_BRAPC|nr:hypothetical protein BpHYR1_021858 [Brachionus plicatilis]